MKLIARARRGTEVLKTYTVEVSEPADVSEFISDSYDQFRRDFPDQSLLDDNMALEFDKEE